MRTRIIMLIAAICLIFLAAGIVGAQVHPATKGQRVTPGYKAVDPVVKHEYIQIGMDCAISGVNAALEAREKKEITGDKFKSILNENTDACVKDRLMEKGEYLP